MNEFIFDELKIGEEATFGAEITEEMMGNFFAISGDSNPLHLEQEYAHKFGFKGRVVYGLLTSSFYSTLVGVYLPGKYALLQGIKKINFLKPVFIGDQLRISGQISHVNEAYKVVEIKARIINQKEEVVSDAIISVGLLA
jgi:3-hydroxybutyryl-CoA dehydratase